MNCAHMLVATNYAGIMYTFLVVKLHVLVHNKNGQGLYTSPKGHLSTVPLVVLFNS